MLNACAHLGAAIDADVFNVASLEHPLLESIQHVPMMCEHEDFPAGHLVGKDVRYMSIKATAAHTQWSATK